MAEIDSVTIGNATLYNGDSVAVAEIVGEVHHTITDPPYEDRTHTAQRLVAGGKRVEQIAFDKMDEATRQAISTAIAKNTLGWALLFCGEDGVEAWRQRMDTAKADYYSRMIWIKPDGSPNFNGDGPGYGYEDILAFRCRPGRATWNGGGRHGVFIHNLREGRDEFNKHQTVKPQRLMVELVTLFTNKDEIVFDPFMGSGSTGVAAIGLGRRFIGIERDPKYFETACKRIEAIQSGGLIGKQYVKTRGKATVSLTSLVAPPKPPAAVPAAKAPKVAKLRAQPAAAEPVPKFGLPKIVVGTKKPVEAGPAAPKERLPDPFAGVGEDVELYDEATWQDRGPGVVGLDVECYRNFFLICLKHFNSGKRRVFELSERTRFDPAVLLEVLNSECLITFNGTNYDLPIIALALKGLDTSALKDVTDRIIGQNMRPWDVEREYGVKVPPFNHVDLLEPNPSIRQGLKTLAGRLHARTIVNLPIRPNATLDRREMSIVTRYCFHDLDATEMLFRAMKEPLQLRVALGKQYGVDMRSRSDAQVGETIVKVMVEKKTGRTPKRPQVMPDSFKYAVPGFVSFKTQKMNDVVEMLRKATFYMGGWGVEMPPELKGLRIDIGTSRYTMGIGGLHSNEEHRALLSDDEHALIDVDVASQYPAIIMKLGLAPPAIGETFFEVYGELMRLRLEAKARGDKTMADGGKIALNGVYGKLGSEFSFMYGPHIMIAVTLTGQLSLLMLIERCELEGIPVMSGNTDGVVIRCPRRKLDRLADIIKGWEQDTGFMAERTDYRAIYNRDVNTYIAVKADGKIKRKGPVGNPWKENDLRGQMSKNPQMTICSDAVVEYILHKTPFEETIRAARDPREFVTVIKANGGAEWRGQPLGEVIRYYWSTDNDPILRVTNKHKVPNTTGGKPMMALPDELPDDVDYERYVSEAEKIAAELAVIEQPGLMSKRRTK